MKYFNIFLLSLISFVAQAEEGHDFVLIHAPVGAPYSCTEHWKGQFKYLGDALGTDCIPSGWYDKDGRQFSADFVNDGYDNKDWFGWSMPVLAPCDCKVVGVHINKVTNKPGIMTPGRATSVTYQKVDGTFILQAHLRELTVKENDSVTRGSVVGHIGNNGYSRNPHIHIAAWKGDKPLQIVFDQSTINLDGRPKK